MRLPARKLYRAFKELDRFSDQQCETFVRAARHGTARRCWSAFWHGTGALVGLTCGWAAAFGISYAIYHEQINAGRGPSSDAQFQIVLTLWMALAFGGAALGWLLTRDLLLRWRIRRVLNTRGRCSMCGYGLTGLPLSTELVVVCPECGYRFAAEPALDEVATDEAGRRRFLPSPDVVPRLWRWLTPALKKQLLRWSLRGALVAMALLVLGAGTYEWFIRRQAAAAQRDRTGAAQLAEFLEQVQGEDDREGPDAWDAFDAAVSGTQVVDGQTWQAALATDPNAPYADFSEIYSPTYPTDPTNAARAEAGRRAARQALEDYRAAGVLARLDEMAARRARLRPPLLTPGQTLMNLMPARVSQARQLARVNWARMTLAAEAGDLPEFISAFEANLALVRMLRHQRTMIEWLVAVALHGMNFEIVKGVLAAHPESEWVGAMQAAWQRGSAPVSYQEPFKAAEIVTLDTLALLFSDPDRVRGGRFSPKLSASWSQFGVARFEKPMRTHEANRRVAKALFAEAKAHVDLDPWERKGWTPAEPPLDPLATFVGRLGTYIGCADQDRLYSRALETALALEAFRCKHGAYPDSLDELVPDCAASLPRDPWSGKPFGYRRLPGTDGGPEYLLYTFGIDGTDDGGSTPPAGNEMGSLNGRAPGTDYVISPDWKAKSRR